MVCSYDIIDHVVFSVALSIAIYSAFDNIPIELDKIPKRIIIDSISSYDECPFLLNPDENGFVVQNLNVEQDFVIILAKLETLFTYLSNPEVVLNFFYDQIQMFHLLNEVLLSQVFLEHFFKTFGLLFFLNTFVLKHISNIYSSKSEEIGDFPITPIIRFFIAERILVISYVFVHHFPDTSYIPPKFKDFSSFISSRFTAMTITSDCTIYAIWSCCIGIIFIFTHIINMRFDRTIRSIENTDLMLAKSLIQQQIVLTLIVFIFFFFFSIGLNSSAIKSITSWNFFYATIFILDSWRCLTRIIYTFSKLFLTLPAIVSNNLDEHLPEEVTIGNFIGDGGRNAKQLDGLKRIFDFITNLFIFAQYSVYLYIGVAINGKFMALILVKRISYSLKNVFNCFSASKPNLIQLYL